MPRITQSDDDMVFLTVEEVELLAGMAERAGRPVDGLIVRWQAYTGARIGETLALKCGDVDVDSRRARIRRTWTDDGKGRLVLGTPEERQTAQHRHTQIPHTVHRTADGGHGRRRLAVPRGKRREPVDEHVADACLAKGRPTGRHGGRGRDHP